MLFTYNDDGIRTSKTVDGVTHTYQLNGSQIVSEQWGDKLLVYLYDASGAPIGMMYRTTSYDINSFDVFWFEKNLQGDIVAVYNSAGTKVAYYTYTDAWGNHSVGYINLSTNEGVQYNPFRYRGYYYDTDLGMYYLQSRYYDPNTCRFINADVYISTGYGIIGNNMFAYCNNIPTCYSDPEGTVFTYTCDYGEGYTLNGWPLEGAGEGGYGGSKNYFGYGTAYYNYVVYSKNAALDAGLGGYYYSGGGSIGGYTAQFAVGKVTVTDSMATSISRNSAVRNPWGKKGGPAHQGTIESVEAIYKSMGYSVNTEVKIDTMGGYKPYRYADLSITDITTGDTFYINVGKQIKSGLPCARERYAIFDIETMGYVIFFVPYN